MIRKLDWDSEFFNINIGEWDADTEPLGSTGKHGKHDLIYVKSSDKINPDIKGFEKSFGETKVVFFKELTTVKEKDNNIFNATGNDSKVLYELAYESGGYSRFKLDYKFGEGKFRKLYNAWIDNSLNGQFADEVLVYIYNDKPHGIVTYKKQDNYGVIGLIAVTKELQGRGIGRKLLNFVETCLIEKNIRELRIPTQLENIQACGFYKNQGYSILETKHIMHYWRI